MSAQNDFKSVIKGLRKEYKMSQRQLAAVVNLTQQAVGKWESGIAEPDIDALGKMAEYFGCSVDYLLGRAVDKAPLGVCQEQTPKKPDNVVIQDFYAAPMDLTLHGMKTKNAPSVMDEAQKLAADYAVLDEHGRRLVRMVADAELSRAENAPQAADLGTIRHYRYRPAAGVDGLTEGEDYEDIPRTPDMPARADYCLTVSGDSMEPYIKDGQMIFVERDAQLNDFDVGVFAVNGAIYVKQYCPGIGGQLYLLSANPARQDANITLYATGADTVTYYGKVILPKKLPRPRYK